MRVYLLAAQAQPLCVVLVTHTAERPRRIVCDHQCRRRAAHQASSTSLQQSNTYTRVAAAVGHCPWDIGADSAGLVSASRSTPDSWGLRQVSLWWMLIAQRLQRTALQHCCTSHWLCECRPRQLQLHWAAGQGRGGAALQACVWLVQSWQAVHTHTAAMSRHHLRVHLQPNPLFGLTALPAVHAAIPCWVVLWACGSKGAIGLSATA